MPKSPTGRPSVHPILMTREQAIEYINAADTKEIRQQRKAEVFHILYSAGTTTFTKLFNLPTRK